MGWVFGEIVCYGFGQFDVWVGDWLCVVSFVLLCFEYLQWVILLFVFEFGIEMFFCIMVCYYQCMGGILLLVVFDCFKFFVIFIDCDGGVMEWDFVFVYVVIQIGFGVEIWVCWGIDCGFGFNFGNWVKSGFFQGCVFCDECEVEEGLCVWIDKINELLIFEFVGKLFVLLLVEEWQCLCFFKVDFGELLMCFFIVVGLCVMVVFEDCVYLMLFELIGFVGVFYFYFLWVVLVVGCYEVVYVWGVDLVLMQ